MDKVQQPIRQAIVNSAVSVHSCVWLMLIRTTLSSVNNCVSPTDEMIWKSGEKKNRENGGEKFVKEFPVSNNSGI